MQNILFEMLGNWPKLLSFNLRLFYFWKNYHCDLLIVHVCVKTFFLFRIMYDIFLNEFVFLKLTWALVLKKQSLYLIGHLTFVDLSAHAQLLSLSFQRFLAHLRVFVQCLCKLSLFCEKLQFLFLCGRGFQDASKLSSNVTCVCAILTLFTSVYLSFYSSLPEK